MNKLCSLFVFFTTLSALSQEPRLMLPVGHKEVIRSVAFSFDGKQLITASDDHTAKLWDTNTGRLLANLTTHTGPVTTAAFSPDGSKIITGSEDGRAILWSVIPLKVLFILQPGPEAVNFACFSSDGNKIMLSASNGSLESFTDLELLERIGSSYMPANSKLSIWSTFSGKKISELEGFAFNVFAPQFNQDNSRVIAPAPDSSAVIWDIRTGKKLITLKGHTGMIMQAGFSPDGSSIITTSLDKTACVWEANTGRKLKTFSAHTSYVMSGTFSDGGTLIATASLDGTVNIWQAEDGRLIKTLRKQGALFYNVQFCYKDKMLAIASFGDLLRIGDIANERIINDIEPAAFPDDPSSVFVTVPALHPDNKSIAFPRSGILVDITDAASGQALITFSGKTKEWHQASYSPDGKTILTAGFDSTVKAWDASDFRLLKSFGKHQGLVFDASFSPENKKIISASGDSTLILWDAATGSKKLILRGHKDRINTARFSADGKKIISASCDQTAIIWDTETGKILNVLKRHTDIVQQAVFSPDGKQAATASDDGHVHFWNTETGEFTGSIPEAGSFITSAGYSPDGKSLVIVNVHDEFSRISVWSTPLLKKKFNLPGEVEKYYHKGEIYFAGFSGDGKLIVTVSSDKTARIWNASDGRPLYILKGHELNVVSASFSPDNKKLVTTSWDRTMRVWDLKSRKLTGTLTELDGNEYLINIPAGYYKSTKGAAKQLYYVTKDLKVITFAQLDVKYNRPDKVLEAIGNTDTALIKSYRKAWEKRIKKLGIDTTQFREGYSVPECNFADRDKIEFEQTNGTLRLDIRGADNNYKLDRFNVWVNESPLFGQRGIRIRKNSNRLDTVIMVTLSQGLNRIETSITNVNGTESYRMPLTVNYTPAVRQKEMLRFIGIGIDRFADSQYNLQYSSKDIRDLAKKLKEKYGNEITIDTLFNENVNLNNVKALKQKLQQTTVNDRVIISYSGHGLLSKDFDYYLSTYSTNFIKPEENGLPYEELESLLDSIPARKKLLLIDACHSGEVDKEELQVINTTSDSLKLIKGLKPVGYADESHLGLKNSFELMQNLFVNVGKSTGATIISAAAGTQFALERNDLKNGVFTYSILEAMQKNPTMKISELKKIVGERVEQLTNGLQKPTSRNETIVVDWSIW